MSHIAWLQQQPPSFSVYFGALMDDDPCDDVGTFSDLVPTDTIPWHTSLYTVVSRDDGESYHLSRRGCPSVWLHGEHASGFREDMQMLERTRLDMNLDAKLDYLWHDLRYGEPYHTL
jgi:hypothetical protein